MFSRRYRVQQKRIYRKFLFTIILVSASFIFLIFIGLPLIANIILLFSPAKSTTESSLQTEENIILPPFLNPIGEATNSAKIKISGITEKEALVYLYVNSSKQGEVKTDSEGKFETKSLKLTEGENTIFAVTIRNDKESSSSQSLKIVYKNKPPAIEIDSPKNEEKFHGEKKQITIIGMTDVGNSLTINDRLVIVDPQGKFFYDVYLTDGENIFKISSLDNAGNAAEKELKIYYSS